MLTVHNKECFRKGMSLHQHASTEKQLDDLEEKLQKELYLPHDKKTINESTCTLICRRHGINLQHASSKKLFNLDYSTTHSAQRAGTSLLKRA